MNSPLTSEALFHLGPVPITAAIITTWVIMAVLVAGAWGMTRRLTLIPDRRQTALELLVSTLDVQIRETSGVEPTPYRSFIGTLFLFILVANLSSLLPGVEPPTAQMETDAALALLVFVSIIWFGIRGAGVKGYLKSFAAPNVVMIPLNILESLTRTFSMFVRLFGNVMSGVFVIGIVASLAGLLVPIPLMALDLLTGLVQAYIFAILALVFIASTVEEGRASFNSEPDSDSRTSARDGDGDGDREKDKDSAHKTVVPPLTPQPLTSQQPTSRTSTSQQENS
ncbi:F0F1 ATP synthase subunit A [Cobetia marina]|uniref:ATP synthase subunit a n=1 Tax=Cobetia marina TaxID=28258 RepID=A0ABU9GAF6_COBMA